jgi:hypothetical protein
MKAYVEVDAKIHTFLIPVLFVEFSASGLGRFIPRERFPFAFLFNNYAMKAYCGVDV